MSDSATEYSTTGDPTDSPPESPGTQKSAKTQGSDFSNVKPDLCPSEEDYKKEQAKLNKPSEEEDSGKEKVSKKERDGEKEEPKEDNEKEEVMKKEQDGEKEDDNGKKGSEKEEVSKKEQDGEKEEDGKKKRDGEKEDDNGKKEGSEKEEVSKKEQDGEKEEAKDGKKKRDGEKEDDNGKKEGSEKEEVSEKEQDGKKEEAKEDGKKEEAKEDGKKKQDGEKEDDNGKKEGSEKEEVSKKEQDDEKEEAKEDGKKKRDGEKEDDNGKKEGSEKEEVSKKEQDGEKEDDNGKKEGSEKEEVSKKEQDGEKEDDNGKKEDSKKEDNTRDENKEKDAPRVLEIPKIIKYLCYFVAILLVLIGLIYVLSHDKTELIPLPQGGSPSESEIAFIKKSWMKDQEKKPIKKLNFFVTGKSGTGKSTLIGTLFDEEFEREEMLESDDYVANINTRTLNINGVSVKVTVWDSPEYEAGSKAMNYLNELTNENHMVDLVICTIKVDDTRIRPEDTDLIKKFSKTFSRNMWRRTIFVLTFANKITFLNEDQTMHQRSDHIRKKLQEWENKIRELLVEENVPNALLEELRFIPAGHKSEPQLFKNEENWMVFLSKYMIFKASDSKRPAVVKALKRHMNINTKEEL